MCLPVAAAAAAGAGTAGTTLTLGTVLSYAGTAMSVLSAFNQANQADKMANYQRSVADQRAKIDMQKANDARQRGVIEEDKQRRLTAALKGKQRATLGSQLVEMDSGSASDLQADTAMMGELDALTIRNNAEREAYYYESSAGLERSEGYMQASASEAKASSLRMSGLASAAGVFGDVDSSWYDSDSALVTQSPKLAWNGKSSFDATGYA